MENSRMIILKNDESKVLVRRDVNFAKDSDKVYSHYLVDIQTKTFDDRAKKVKYVDDVIRLTVARNDIDMYKVLKMIFLGEDSRELVKVSKTTTDFTGKRKTTVSYEVRSNDGLLKATLVPDSLANETMLNYVFENLPEKVEIEESEEQ